MSIERDFDASFIGALALREKQIQQNYRPVIAVHKWFARRPGALFRGLLLAEFGPPPLRDSYYRSQNFSGKRIADPFMGGGTPLLEANRTGCDVVGFDINPMAYWIVRQEIASLDLAKYRQAAQNLVKKLTDLVGEFYKTRCRVCGSREASVKYFLWVKQQQCPQCSMDFDLFPGYLLAEDRRHPANVFVCPSCGKLTETKDRIKPGLCYYCGRALLSEGPARHSSCACPHCGYESKYASPRKSPPKHRMFAIEYYCPDCKPAHQGRFFKEPDEADLEAYKSAVSQYQEAPKDLIPRDHIPAGDETDRLRRWGYSRYDQMFNERQLLGLSYSARLITATEDKSVRHALATNLSDLLRYQNMLCRYDTMALKSLDIFSVHGFPVGLIQCESNLLGISSGNGMSVGSGGWSNIIEKFYKAKRYCIEPFEIRMEKGRKRVVYCREEWIGEHRRTLYEDHTREVSLNCQDSANQELAPNSLDAVLTDPPYFGNVQYAELMDFCYIWLRKLLGHEVPAFRQASTRNKKELTGNFTMDRGIEHFAEGLSAVFQKMAKALKPGAPLAFTFHHNKLDSYYPVAVALLDAGLVCTASLPCPAEMGASIHINGTGSSIVDSVLVCRSTGAMLKRWLADTASGIAEIVQADLAALRQGGLQASRGDIRCVIFGHLVRLAVWRLRGQWDKGRPVRDKLETVRKEISCLPGQHQIEHALGQTSRLEPRVQSWAAMESAQSYGWEDDAIPF
ncbi:MAG: DNA methylase [Thermodesulfobacteriota bacterium]